MKTPLSPTTTLIFKAAQRVLRDKTSVVSPRGKQWDSQFKSLVNMALKCEYTDVMLMQEMNYLVEQGYLVCITKNDEYGDNTKHYMGDPS